MGRVIFTKHHPRNVESKRIGEVMVELRAMAQAVEREIQEAERRRRRPNPKRIKQHKTLTDAVAALDHLQDIYDDET